MSTTRKTRKTSGDALASLAEDPRTLTPAERVAAFRADHAAWVAERRDALATLKRDRIAAGLFSWDENPSDGSLSVPSPATLTRPPLTDLRPVYGPPTSDLPAWVSVTPAERVVRPFPAPRNPAAWESRAASALRDGGSSVAAMGHAAGLSPDGVRALQRDAQAGTLTYSDALAMLKTNRERVEPRHRVSDDYSAVGRWVAETSPAPRKVPAETLTDLDGFAAIAAGRPVVLPLPVDGPGTRAMLTMSTPALLGWSVRSTRADSLVTRGFSAPVKTNPVRPEMSPRVMAAKRPEPRCDAGVPADAERVWSDDAGVKFRGKVVRDLPRITPENPYPRTRGNARKVAAAAAAKRRKMTPAQRAAAKLSGTL